MQYPSSTIAGWMARHGGFTVDTSNDRACDALASMIELVGTRMAASVYDERARGTLDGFTVGQLVEVAVGLGFGGRSITTALVDVESGVLSTVAAHLGALVQSVRVP